MTAIHPLAEEEASSLGRLTILRARMTTTLHRELASGRWQQLSLVEQLANIGSEVGRAARAKATGNEARFDSALDRCLELFDLTLADDRWRGRREEVARAREIVCDFLVGENACRSTAESLEAYFLPFAVAARGPVPLVPHSAQGRPDGHRPEQRRGHHGAGA